MNLHRITFSGSSCSIMNYEALKKLRNVHMKQGGNKFDELYFV